MNPITQEDCKCKCCGKSEMDGDFLHKLNLAQDLAEVQFEINSGYRCDKHNTEVGSTSMNHVKGKAADIKALTGPKRGKILKGLYKAGFTKIGIGKTFIHADSMDTAESAWMY